MSLGGWRIHKHTLGRCEGWAANVFEVRGFAPLVWDARLLVEDGRNSSLLHPPDPRTAPYTCINWTIHSTTYVTAQPGSLGLSADRLTADTVALGDHPILLGCPARALRTRRAESSGRRGALASTKKNRGVQLWLRGGPRTRVPTAQISKGRAITYIYNYILRYLRYTENYNPVIEPQWSLGVVLW